MRPQDPRSTAWPGGSEVRVDQFRVPVPGVDDRGR
jgi:hypothetical protein